MQKKGIYLSLFISLSGLLCACQNSQYAANDLMIHSNNVNASLSSAGKGAIAGAAGGAALGAVASSSHILPYTAIGSVAGAIIADQYSKRYSDLTDQGVMITKWGPRTEIDIPSDRLFDTDDVELSNNGEALLSKIASMVKPYFTQKIYVSCFTDDLGSEAYRQDLTDKRAYTVAGFLWAYGVPHDNLRIEGFSSHNPIASNRRVDGSAMNRRVEIVIDSPLRET